MPDMVFIVLRYVAGYLLQVVPCAALCFAPFGYALRLSPRRMAAIVSGCIVLACVLFTFASLAPMGPFEQYRYFISDLIFMALLVVFMAAYWRMVAADRARKAFVFLAAMSYGCLMVVLQSVISLPLGILYEGDGWMYYPPKLLLSAVLNGCAFPGGWVLMRRVVQPQLASGISERYWWRMCAVPVIVLVVLVGFYWFPIQLDVPKNVANVMLAIAAAVGSIGGCAVYLRASCEMGAVVNERDELSRHVTELLRERESQRLRYEKEREAMRGTDAGGTSSVTFETPGAIVSFDPREVCYLEVYGHTLVIHFSSGRTERLSFSLSQARELLPQGLFVQCHRSYLVNREAVRSLRRYEITLAGGESIPVSKQRYAEVAVACSQGGEPTD